MKSTLIIATGNAHKVDEIRAILGREFEYLTLNDFPNAPKVVEDANTFAGNATKKAVELARWIAGQNSFSEQPRGLSDKISSKPQLPIHILADDSGLEVDALNGAPGVHSARFAALDKNTDRNASDSANLSKLLRLMQAIAQDKRTARFRCVIALTPLIFPAVESASPVCYADEQELQTQLFQGTCDGRINSEPRGKGGFGYDPVFIPTGYEQSFAELGEAVKNRLSHRGRALAALKESIT